MRKLENDAVARETTVAHPHASQINSNFAAVMATPSQMAMQNE